MFLHAKNVVPATLSLHILYIQNILLLNVILSTNYKKYSTYYINSNRINKNLFFFFLR